MVFEAADQGLELGEDLLVLLEDALLAVVLSACDEHPGVGCLAAVDREEVDGGPEEGLAVEAGVLCVATCSPLSVWTKRLGSAIRKDRGRLV